MFLYDLIGKLFGEEKSPLELEELASPQHPDNFCPGLLFDISATWILFLRKLLVPEYVRNGRPDCVVTCDTGCKAPRGWQ